MIYNLCQEDTFAAYRLPNETHHYLLRSDSGSMPFGELGGQPAFVFHPFEETTKAPALAIPAEECWVNPVFAFESGHENGVHAISETDYIPLLEDFVQEIQRGTLHKAICSRIILKKMEARDLYPLFMLLKERYPLAFVYLVNIPGVGCWMGATPEVLLTHEADKQGETVALAGTRPLGSAGDWARKEILEQQMVERYMANVLIGRKMNFQKIGPFTARAGRVAHLKTRFRFPAPADWRGLALDIHPSPAVCGLPKGEARRFINRLEPHRRDYYCGFLGPVNLHGKAQLFVNLRCMQVVKGAFALYVGGGVTAGSIPEKELEETRWKSGTLADIIEEVYQNLELI